MRDQRGGSQAHRVRGEEMSRAVQACPHCGCDLVKVRSPADHRRFFAILQKAFENWPEAHPEIQPSSVDHLRAYLLVTAGHHETSTIDLSWITQNAAENPSLLTLARLNVEATIAAALGRGDYVFTRARGDVVEVLRPKSIAWSQLDQRAFGPIREAVEALVENALGVTASDLLKAKAA